MPSTGGDRPLCAWGTQFIAHKVAEVERVVTQFGAYFNYQASLSEDPAVKSVDRHNLKGFLLQWQSVNMLLRCALFHDLLKPAAILCKVLQQDDVCVVEAIEATLKTCKAIEKLASTSFDDFPTVKMVSSRRVHSVDSSTTYQEANLTKHEEGVTCLKNHRNKYTTSVFTCLRYRLKAHRVQIYSLIP